MYGKDKLCSAPPVQAHYTEARLAHRRSADIEVLVQLVQEEKKTNAASTNWNASYRALKIRAAQLRSFGGSYVPLPQWWASRCVQTGLLYSTWRRLHSLMDVELNLGHVYALQTSFLFASLPVRFIGRVYTKPAPPSCQEFPPFSSCSFFKVKSQQKFQPNANSSGCLQC